MIELRWREVPINEASTNAIPIEGQILNRYLVLEYRQQSELAANIPNQWIQVPIVKG